MSVVVDCRLATCGSCEQLLAGIENVESNISRQMQVNLSVTCGGDVAELSKLLREL